MHAYRGDGEPLGQAVTRLREVLPATSPPRRLHVQADLLQALGRIRARDTRGGLQHAATVHDDCPADQRTKMVISVAEQVVESVPEQDGGEPMVTELGTLLAGSHLRAIT
ncbi:hypothetical protein SMC26_22720 [Actinomadura fulvescens]|uniref:hypothetical protein n=1 Tax=Actinomadura fulvescens TaxID=46160 RepID=UPI0031D195B8